MHIHINLETSFSSHSGRSTYELLHRRDLRHVISFEEESRSMHERKSELREFANAPARWPIVMTPASSNSRVANPHLGCAFLQKLHRGGYKSAAIFLELTWMIHMKFPLLNYSL